MARVIRPAGDSRRIPREAYDAIAEARERLDRARSEADRVVAEATRDAAAIRDAARAEGLRTAADESALLLARAKATYDGAIAGAETDVRRVLRVAIERVIRTELAEEPAHVRRTAAELLERAQKARSLRLRAHPDDVSLLAALLPTMPASAAARIEADPGVERGGCILESDLGELDARVQTQIDRLRAILERT